MTALLRTCAFLSIAVVFAALAEEVEPAASSDVAIAPTADGRDIHEIIASVSSRTRKRFIVDPRVRAHVTLVGLVARDVDYPLLLTILNVHGFSAHERDGVVVVTPDAVDRQIATPVVPADKIRAADAEVVTAILPVKNISAGQLVPILRPLMPQRAHLAAAVERNALIIVDGADNVRRIVEIAETLDRLPAVVKPAAMSGDATDQ
jgi:general secretion pathway protein D